MQNRNKTNKPLILMVEDNIKLQQANARVLAAAGYDTACATTLSQARELILQCTPSAIILDILLPDGNGLDFLDELREHTLAPVLLLTSLTDKKDRLAGLRKGGDDYIAKPYDIDELVARVDAFIRRDNMLRKDPQAIEHEPLLLNIVTQQAFLDGVDMKLSPKEFAILMILLKNEGIAVEAQMLFTEVWGTPWKGDSNALWKQISNLKMKLESMNRHVRIFNKKGVGYGLEITS